MSVVCLFVVVVWDGQKLQFLSRAQFDLGEDQISVDVLVS
jgi:hypothetical protein